MAAVDDDGVHPFKCPACRVRASPKVFDAAVDDRPDANCWCLNPACRVVVFALEPFVYGYTLP